MVKYTTLIKVIEEELKKCRATEKAQRIGSTGVWRYLRNEEGEMIGSSLTYSDGTTINYNADEEITSITYEGEEINFLEEKSNDFFRGQADKMIEQHGQDNYATFSKYGNIYSDYSYYAINNYLRGRYDVEKLEYKLNLSEKKYDFIMDNKELFDEMLRDNDLSDYGSFFTIRGVEELHDNDDISKRIVSDKAYTSQTVGMDSATTMTIFGNDGDGWLIISPYMKGNNARSGAYMDIAINDYNMEKYGCPSVDENEFLSAPNTKFMRTIIDVDNRIIIQEPYAPK